MNRSHAEAAVKELMRHAAKVPAPKPIMAQEWRNHEKAEQVFELRIGQRDRCRWYVNEAVLVHADRYVVLDTLDQMWRYMERVREAYEGIRDLVDQ
jgi:hypothetical protein